MTRPDRDGKRGLLGRIASGASDRMLDIVDPNQVLDHVDVDNVLDRVDINALLDRVDINRLLERVDVDDLMTRVDMDALLERVDVRDLVERAGIPEIVAESTSHLTGSALDLFRKPIVGLDEILFRFLNRLVGRNPNEYPKGPGDLITWVDEHAESSGAVKTGRFAGPLTRLLAVLVDSTVITFGFTLIVAGVVFLIRLFDPAYEIPANTGYIYGLSLAAWGLVYLWVSLAVFGKTIGKMLLGVRVVSSDGQVVLSGRQPLIRVITYPLSFVVLGLGLLGVVFNPKRQAWHDHFANTVVVYDWGSRTAAMPTPLADFLERRGSEV